MQKVWGTLPRSGLVHLVAFATKRGVQLYPSKPELLFNQLCEKAGANLSQEEWTDYIGEAEPWRATCPEWRNPHNTDSTRGNVD